MLTIIGAGKFGQAISKLLGSNPHQLVDVEPDGSYSSATVENIKNADQLIICVPSAYLEACCTMNARNIKPTTQILSCVKGVFPELQTPTELIQRTFKNPLAAFNGPNLSTEIMLGRPAMATIAGDDAETWATLFRSPTFAVSVDEDSVGSEFGAAVKNIIALGAGFIDGYYDGNACNTMGSFVTFALSEVEQLYTHKSSSPLPRLSFIGDLFATCFSETSRNHQYGNLFGTALREKKPLPQAEGTVEGYRTLAMVHAYLHKHHIASPVVEALYSIFYEQGSMEDLIESWHATCRNATGVL